MLRRFDVGLVGLALPTQRLIESGIMPLVPLAVSQLQLFRESAENMALTVGLVLPVRYVANFCADLFMG